MSKKTMEFDGPEFLKREAETEAQREKRLAKYKTKDMSGGLKVKKLPEPVDPKIAKAIKKDLSATDATDDLQDSLRSIKRPRGYAELARLADTLPDAAREAAEDSKKKTARKKDGFTYSPKKAKKGNSVLDKALKARDELNAKTKTAIVNAVAKSPDKRSKSEKKVAVKAVKKAEKPEDYEPRKGTKAAKVFDEQRIRKAAELIKRKGGALSSEIQKACSWKPVIVRRFVRDIARKRLAMRVICERGPDSTYRIG